MLYKHINIAFSFDYNYYRQGVVAINQQRHFEYRYYIGKLDVFSKQNKNNKRIYKILGLKIAV